MNSGSPHYTISVNWEACSEKFNPQARLQPQTLADDGQQHVDRDLQNKASGLNLVVAAIVLWNTVYLDQAVAALERQGTPVPADCLPHLSPLGWEHIHLTGDYLWDLRQTTTLERLWALRRGTLTVQNVPESKAG